MESEVTITQMVIRLLAAAGLASLIGIERELRRRPAGLRTHMLVSLGAAAFLLIGQEILFTTGTGPVAAQIDPTRIIEGVITGIGFLGAGCIIQSRGSVQGITTGAAVWIAGAVGLACAVGHFILAAAVTVITLLIVILLGLFEQLISDNDSG